MNSILAKQLFPKRMMQDYIKTFNLDDPMNGIVNPFSWRMIYLYFKSKIIKNWN